jgi:hypothetical protein
METFDERGDGRELGTLPGVMKRENVFRERAGVYVQQVLSIFTARLRECGSK